MQFVSFNITGDGAAHPLTDISGAKVTKCKWFQLECDSGTMTVGGPEVDATHGMPVPTSGTQFSPPFAQSMEFYDLASIYFFLSNSETGVLLCAF